VPAVPRLQLGNALGFDVKAGDRVAFAKLDRQGQADVAEADDGDGLSDEVHVAGCQGLTIGTPVGVKSVTFA